MSAGNPDPGEGSAGRQRGFPKQPPSSGSPGRAPGTLLPQHPVPAPAGTKRPARRQRGTLNSPTRGETSAARRPPAPPCPVYRGEGEAPTAGRGLGRPPLRPHPAGALAEEPGPSAAAPPAPHGPGTPRALPRSPARRSTIRRPSATAHRLLGHAAFPAAPAPPPRPAPEAAGSVTRRP